MPMPTDWGDDWEKRTLFHQALRMKSMKTGSKRVKTAKYTQKLSFFYKLSLSLL
jgi:hypothetical protein